MVRYFNNPDWSNAYVQRDLPDSLDEFAKAASAAFNAQIIGISPTDSRFNQFNGINYGGKEYVNLDANVSFINIAGHEIGHTIESNNPALYAWFAQQAKPYLRNFDEYQNKLNSLLKEGEEKHTAETAEKELLNDFIGDALADPKFLAQLAEADGSKFKQLLRTVIDWLKAVGDRLAYWTPAGRANSRLRAARA